MQFEPLYYDNRVRVIGDSRDFQKEKINVINPAGRSGIVTLWTPPENIWKGLYGHSPALFERDSPLVTLTSLYGNGLPQMMANLANNPQIEYLAVMGACTKVVPSRDYLLNLINEGIDDSEEGPLGKIKGTSMYVDKSLVKDLFKHLKIEDFPIGKYDLLANFVSQAPTRIYSQEDRKPIRLIEPVFKDFPSDIANHHIRAANPIEAWMEVMYNLDRFGRNIELKKGKRRTLFNLEVLVDDPSVESEEKLSQFGFKWEELDAYRRDIISSDKKGLSYTYGDRMRSYFGVDALANIVKRLKEDPADRRAFLTTWDNKNDILSPDSNDSSVPCLTSIYFSNDGGKLFMTADFRTHNASSAWLLNMYGLRSIQEYVSNETGIPAGRLNVKSRWIGIDPDDAKTNKALELVSNHRKIKIDVHDPRGYFVPGIEGNTLVLEHFSHDGKRLKKYEGEKANDIKDQLRQDSAISDPDHANWVGMQLGALHYQIHGKTPT